ncbi:thioredoxin family protein [Pseudorhodoplanes sinuspersici]|uniref:Thiol reductase thioredoxin n=1 Tax=Pseudorhodoplanes sinuspersici TaxID=1235591 RepID=A0A1W6ZN55_9HYPH|nr:thioredoxin family protein [Pseudorhodoplanes sinuspersici]ARP98833.1 thiol reductase thioredoxin [Pseudorhodoplanes sinuspersici]RKE69551.1 thiol-disulfide isomerase/thioredoxin [Pseudorhodoplanes sinuspersici]
MLSKRNLLGALGLCLTLSLASVAFAQDKKPFDRANFEAAQAAGKPILIDVSAPWCPTCKAQAPILSRLMSDPRFKGMIAFSIDYDSQKDLLRTFNVQRQSTLIVFKGKQEAGRSTGDTNPASIEAMLAKAI